VSTAGTLVFALVLALAAAEAVQAERFEFAGESTRIIFAEGRERTLLSGNARVTSDTMNITAEEIEIYGEDFRYALCTGNVRASDEERGIRIESERLFFDREAEILRAEGDAFLEDLDNELVVRGGLLESRQQEELTIAQMQVRIFGEELTARGEYARYRRDEQVLELSGLPVVFWQGDEYRASRIIVNTETEEIDLEGDVRGSITPSDEEEEAEGEADAGGAATGENGGEADADAADTVEDGAGSFSDEAQE
jgi:lipopolysaccharide export system protein LptA